MSLPVSYQTSRQWTPLKGAILLGSTLLVSLCLFAPTSSSSQDSLLFTRDLKDVTDNPAGGGSPTQDAATVEPTEAPLPVLPPSTSMPTTSPSTSPSVAPSGNPTLLPTNAPTSQPSNAPSSAPTQGALQVAITVPDIPDSEIVQVMNWIKAEVTVVRTPFCWKATEGRGVGLIPQECPAGKERIGALCYTKCPRGYVRFGFDCHQTCPSGFRDDGLFCRKSEYGRGAGYTIWDLGGCERDHGRGNCEQWGLIYYPKCKRGYHNVACCICRPNSFSCSSYGLGGQLDLSCGKKIIIGDPTPMICNSNQEYDAGLCYPFCPSGMYGVGPVCWSHCAQEHVDCGAACASSGDTCASQIFDQVLSVLIIAANVATLGLATPATAGAGLTIRVAGKTVAGTTKVGKAMVKAVTYLQTVKSPGKLGKGVEVTETMVNPINGQIVKVKKYFYDVSSVGFDAVEAYRQAYADDFATQTSPRINSIIDSRFTPATAEFVKKSWADIQLNEMKVANDWQIADTVLDAASLVDVTGVTGVVAAFANPICGVTIPFPCVDAVVTTCP